MIKIKLLLSFFFICFIGFSQDLSVGYIPNDLSPHPMQELSKPAYLVGVADPSFPNTTVRRISEANNGEFVVPMYSTIQAWNANETYMILYSSSGEHQLLNGQDYTFIRNLSDISPADIETIIWHFSSPEVLFYHESGTNDFIAYNVETMTKTIIVNFNDVSGCSSGISLGNDIQMMSWDSDVISFRCGNTAAYYYRISTSTLTEFNIADIGYTAPMPFPSGNLFFHLGKIYDANGNEVREFNVDGVEHSCLGKLSNGDDAYFAIAFEEGPNGGCQGTLVAHNATNGNCFAVTSYADYGYPQAGTHISSLAHNNTQGGWVAVSMEGFDLDGQDVLDQELFIAKVNATDADVYRVAHHRSDEDDIDYFGEPHVTISPSGTRLLFGSDWSGTEDGLSVDSYVAELNAHNLSIVENSLEANISVFPNPVTTNLQVISIDESTLDYEIYTVNGKLALKGRLKENSSIGVSSLSNGLYFIRLEADGKRQTMKFIKE